MNDEPTIELYSPSPAQVTQDIAASIEPYSPSPAQVTQDIAASHDSVAMIAALVAANNASSENKDTVQRNIYHLRSCLTLPHIISSATSADKIAFANAATLGEDWIG